jgi:hypothetical protein
MSLLERDDIFRSIFEVIDLNMPDEHELTGQTRIAWQRIRKEIEKLYEAGSLEKYLELPSSIK